MADKTAVVAALAQITRRWAPGAGVNPAELDEARMAIAIALRTSSPRDVTDPSGPTGAIPPNRFDRGPAVDAFDRTQAAPRAQVRPFVRSSGDVGGQLPFDVAGMAVTRTLGPFVDDVGIEYVVDLIALPSMTVLHGPEGVVALVDIGDPLFGPEGERFEIGPGGLWVNAGILTGAISGFIGFAFQGGVTEQFGLQRTPDGSFVLGPGARVMLQLEPVRPVPAAAPGPSGDALALGFETPARVTVELRSTGITVTSVEALSATVYGRAVAVGRTEAAPLVVELDGHFFVVFPGDVSTETLAVASCLSSDFVVSGTAPVGVAGWGLRVAPLSPGALGRPTGPGGLLATLGAGWSAQFGSDTTGTDLGEGGILAEPGSLTVVARTRGRIRRERFPLWEGPAPSGVVPAPARRRSDMAITSPPESSVTAVLTPGRERVVVGGTVEASLERPVAADGSRMPLAYEGAAVAFVNDDLGPRVVVLGRQPAEAEERAVALENALVGVHASDFFVFLGRFARREWEGSLVVGFPFGRVLPTLPDPYAASFATPDEIDRRTIGMLLAPLSWTAGKVPELRFLARGDGSLIRTSGDRSAVSLPDDAFTLLDLSSRADQFGVAVVMHPLGRAPNIAFFVDRDFVPIAIDGQALAVPDGQAAIYALPGISWEPVVSEGPPVDWHDAFSPNDGPATVLLTTTVDLVPVEPLVAVPHFQRAAGSVPVLGRFTLPFGLTAILSTTPKTPADQHPRFGLVKGVFAAGLAAGLQLAIHAGKGVLGSSALPGSTSTGPSPEAAYGNRILGDSDPLSAAPMFNDQFGSGDTAQIPVERVDLSGYGTSMFSDWALDEDDFVGVVRSRFDVLVGRTAFELVQIQTLILPFRIRITRTIIFDRSNTGLVMRRDTGWKAVGDGAFSGLGSLVIKGAMDRVTNVRNITVGAGARIEFPSPDLPDFAPGNPPPPPPKVPPAAPRKCTFVPVFFDADVVMDPARVTTTTNGRISDRAAGTRIAGWAQSNIGYAASSAEILTLMGRLGPAGVTGSVGCVVAVGAEDPANPQFTVNVSSLRVAATRAQRDGRPAAIAVALQGTPRLPRDGAWSVTRRAAGSQTPTAVDAGAAVPLIRAGELNVRGTRWRLLEPADALSASAPTTFYGVMQGTGTSKTLFEHVVIGNDGRALEIDGPHAPNVADVGALLGSTDAFPDLGTGLKLGGALNPLKLGGDGFAQTFRQSLASVPDRTLFHLGGVDLVLGYADADLTFVLDPAASPRWSLEITRLHFKVLIGGFGPGALLTFTGDFAGNELDPPAVKNIQVDYGPALGLIKDVFSGLGEIVSAVGGDVRLDVAFSGNHLSVRNYIAVPAIPLGFGELRDVTLDMGFDATIPTEAAFHIGLGSREKPFTWLVSPLSGTGALVLGSRNGDSEVFVQAGLGAGLGINLAVAAGSAAITLQLAIAVSGQRFAITASLLGQAEVSVLGGVASASLTLCASITMVPLPALSFPPDDIQLTAAVAVGIHISICWVVSVDFDGSWEFSQTVPVHL